MEPVTIVRRPTVHRDEHGHPVIRVELDGGCDEAWERLFEDHGFADGHPYPTTVHSPAVVEIAVDPAQARAALDWLTRRVLQVNEALRVEDQRESTGEAALAAAVATWWEHRGEPTARVR